MKTTDLKIANWWEQAENGKIDDENALSVSPEEVVGLAIKHGTPSIAFTYNDPTIFGEYVIDISRLARDEGIKSVMVTAGYIDKNARKDVYKYIDAANVDLKAFTEEFYHKITFSHNCNFPLIKRGWHDVLVNHIKGGKCPKCLTTIPGVFQ